MLLIHLGHVQVQIGLRWFPRLFSVAFWKRARVETGKWFIGAGLLFLDHLQSWSYGFSRTLPGFDYEFSFLACSWTAVQLKAVFVHLGSSLPVVATDLTVVSTLVLKSVEQGRVSLAVSLERHSIEILTGLATDFAHPLLVRNVKTIL